MKYEYKIMNMYNPANFYNIADLNELGQEGWQLVAIVDRGYKDESWVFTRHLSNTSSGQDKTCAHRKTSVVEFDVCINCDEIIARR